MISPISKGQGSKCDIGKIDAFGNKKLYTMLMGRSFDLDVNCETIYKDETPYKMWLQKDNLNKGIDGFYEFTSYPYDEIKFNLGDYITWKESVWIITSLDNVREYEVKGRIRKCTQKLKWYSPSGDIVEKWAAIRNIDSGSISTDQSIDTRNAIREVKIPLDEDTIPVHTRRLKTNLVIVSEQNEYQLASVNSSDNDTLATWKLDYIERNDNYIDWDSGVIKPTDDEIFSIISSMSNIELLQDTHTNIVVSVRNGDDVDVTSSHKLKYLSSNGSVASVDENGKVSAIGQGSAKINISLDRNPAVFLNIDVSVTEDITDEYGYIFNPNVGTIERNTAKTIDVQLKNKGNIINADISVVVDESSNVDVDKYYFEQRDNNTIFINNYDGADGKLRLNVSSSEHIEVKEIIMSPSIF